MKTKETHGLTRIDENLLRLENAEQVDVRVFANEHVQIEATAVEELKGLLGLQSTLERFLAADAEAFAQRPRIERISLTPDFHKARGIPVGTVLETSGFVVPQAIGNDISCGMRLHKTSLEAGQAQWGPAALCWPAVDLMAPMKVLRTARAAHFPGAVR